MMELSLMIIFFSVNISELNLKSIIMMPIIYKLNFALVVLTIISLSVWQYFRSDALGDFRGKPYLVIFSLFYFGAMIGLFFIKKIKNDSHSFLLSTMLILGGITSSLASLIPVILPSTNSVNESLTI